jgi:hypothetical protein
MTMYLMQALIFCAVVGSNIHWQWTPNQYLASGIGAGLAWIATKAIVRYRDRRARRKPNKNEATSHRASFKPRGREQRPALLPQCTTRITSVLT